MRGRPRSSLKKGPGASRREAMHDSSAVTGHNGELVRPRWISTPAPNWSHLYSFNLIQIAVGLLGLSTATSPQARWTAVSKAATDGTVISPERKKPKKHTVAAAHIMRVLWVTSDLSHSYFMAERAARVIGSRTLGGRFGSRALTRLTPARSSFSRGRVDVSRGSGRPRESYRLHIAAK